MKGDVLKQGLDSIGFGEPFYRHIVHAAKIPPYERTIKKPLPGKSFCTIFNGNDYPSERIQATTSSFVLPSFFCRRPYNSSSFPSSYRKSSSVRSPWACLAFPFSS